MLNPWGFDSLFAYWRGGSDELSGRFILRRSARQRIEVRHVIGTGQNIAFAGRDAG